MFLFGTVSSALGHTEDHRACDASIYLSCGCQCRGTSRKLPVKDADSSTEPTGIGGCAFAARCPNAKDRWWQDKPAIDSFWKDDHLVCTFPIEKANAMSAIYMGLLQGDGLQ